MVRLNSFLKFSCLSVLFIIVLLSCSPDKSFNRDKWLKHNTLETYNPRAYMIDDLLENYLKPGLEKDSILALLGKPYTDGIGPRLPKDIVIPDSLDINTLVNLKGKIRDKKFEELDEFHRLNSKLDTLMLYPVGQSVMDPNFLVIKLDGNGKASEFWVEQH